MKQGKVWLVGAGPSDPGLLTIKGKSVLEKADAIVYDRLVSAGILAMAPFGAKLIDVGKNAGNHTLPQEEINALLIRLAQEGKKVVRLKGGDPFLFGRGGEEAEALADAGILYEVVPGVTTATAVPAYFGIPVTHREEASSLHLITAHRKNGVNEPIDYSALTALGSKATLVFFMGIAELDEICSGLIAAGKPPETPAAVLEKGTSARQKKVVATLSDLPQEAAQKHIRTPGLIVVGNVCRLAEKLSWTEKEPLFGARVFVTRPRHKTVELSRKISELGAEAVELPAIKTEFLNGFPDLKKRKSILNRFNWLICSSSVGAEAFFGFLRQERIDIRTLSSLRFAAVGDKTKETLEERGILVECCPARYSGKELAKLLQNKITPQDRLLALVPENRESAFVSALYDEGIACETAAVYRTLSGSVSVFPKLRRGDYALFASTSAVNAFADMVHDQTLEMLKAVCIGAQTAAAAKKLGMRTFISKQATTESLIELLIELHQKERLESSL